MQTTKNVLFITALILLLPTASHAADDTQTQCAQWVDAYLTGLKTAEAQINQYPSLANTQKGGLSLEDVMNLQKTKPACDVKLLINQAIRN